MTYLLLPDAYILKQFASNSAGPKKAGCVVNILEQYTCVCLVWQGFKTHNKMNMLDKLVLKPIKTRQGSQGGKS